MGRAWMQTGQQDDHALKLLETSIAFYDQNADTYLQKALLLNRMKLSREAREPATGFWSWNRKISGDM